MTKSTALPSVSVVAPLKHSRSIADTLRSLAEQTYGGRTEVILVGDCGDAGFDAVRGQDYPFDLRLIEVKVNTPGRDSNAKRERGLKEAAGDIVVVFDADVLPDPKWMETAVRLLTVDGHRAVAGPLVGLGDSFWDGYIDKAGISKTPRMAQPYLVTSGNTDRYKLPVTANFACRREVLDLVGPPDVRMTNSYEDYEWFQRMVDRGVAIYCTPELSVDRYHRVGFKPLLGEYKRSGKGCADFMVLHPDSLFAVKRRQQLLTAPFAALLGVAGVWFWPPLALCGVAVLAAWMVVSGARARHVVAMLYPLLGLLFAARFVQGAYSRFTHRGFQPPIASQVVWERDPVAELGEEPWLPSVSVVVPVKNRPTTTRQLVGSLLRQEYAGTIEIIVVGDTRDSTWPALTDFIVSGQIRAIETDVFSEGRDANAKRNVGLEAATGELLALTDSDMVPPPSWVANAVRLMQQTGHKVAAGSMIGMETEGFWGTYTDKNPFGSKTPRMDPAYVLTAQNFGQGRHKPPITASLFFTRDVYARVGGLDANFVTPYEDYPFADVLVGAGYDILCTHELAAAHYHRDGFWDLCKEYWKAGHGCADYVVMYQHSPFAGKRAQQLLATLLVYAVGIAALVMMPAIGLLPLLGLGALGAVSWRKTKSKYALLFPAVTAFLGTLFTGGMVYGLIRRYWCSQSDTEILQINELTRTEAMK